MRRDKGITLVALVITIIVLLILAGVSIATITGEDGILKRSTTAKEKNDEAIIDENGKIGSYEDVIDNYNSRGDTITISKTELQELIKQEVKNQMGSENTGYGSKEVLWETEATGTREVALEKNISDYDLLIVYYVLAGGNNSGEITFETSENKSYRSNYTYTSSYVLGTISINTSTNIVNMSIDGNHSEWNTTTSSYLSKIVGIKL